MHFNFKLIAVFVLLGGLAWATPTERNAINAFNLMVKRGDFDPKPAPNSDREDPSRPGNWGTYSPEFGYHHWLETVSSDKPHTQLDDNGQKWTVFVVRAFMLWGPTQSSAQRFSVRAVIPLVEQGGKIKMGEKIESETVEAVATEEEKQKAVANDLAASRTPESMASAGRQSCRELYNGWKREWGLSSKFVDVWNKLSTLTAEDDRFHGYKRKDWGDEQFRQFDRAFWAEYEAIVQSDEYQHALTLALEKIHPELREYRPPKN